MKYMPVPQSKESEMEQGNNSQTAGWTKKMT